MTINYIEKNDVKLFSFSRHDFQSFEEGEFIDGGWDYTKIGSIPAQSAKISDVIQDIRKQFTLTSTLTKEILCNLDANHIINILIGLVSNIPDHPTNYGWRATQVILLEELKLRHECIKTFDPMFPVVSVD